MATLSDNGTTLLTQDFFIWVQATDHLTIANIVLILVILLEIYQIAALGRAKIPKTPASTPPTTGSSGTPPSTSPPSGAPPPGPLPREDRKWPEERRAPPAARYWGLP